jgi:hypothetical protein
MRLIDTKRRVSIMLDFLQFEGYLPESKIKLKSFVMDLQVQIPLNLIISFEIKSGPALLPVFNFLMHLFTSLILKDEVLLTVSCPIFPSILIAKSLLTGSLKNRSIDNLDMQKKSISMKNSLIIYSMQNRNKPLIKL